MREQTVVDLLRQEGPMSRAAIARRCNVSKPTVSNLVESLLLVDLLVEDGRETRGNGRPGRLLAFNDDAAFVVGMDVGGTTTRAVLANLGGRVVQTVREPTQGGSPAALVDQLARIVAAFASAPPAAGRLLEVAIGTPGVVDRSRRRITIAPNLPALETDGLLDDLERALTLPLTVLNDVNAAALGELRHGAGSDVDDLAYVSIGTGLGLGLALGRRLHHGAAGRAGELGQLPYPPGSGTRLEEHLSGAGVRRRHLAAGGSGEPEDAFQEAEEGLEPGASVVAAFLADLAWALTAVTTMLDPQRIVLGGGIGLRCAHHIEAIAAAVARAAGFSTDIAIAHLGDDAGLTGAVASALEPARSVTRWLGGGSMMTTR